MTFKTYHSVAGNVAYKVMPSFLLPHPPRRNHTSNRLPLLPSPFRAGRYEISTFRKIGGKNSKNTSIQFPEWKFSTSPKVDFNNFNRKKRFFTTSFGRKKNSFRFFCFFSKKKPSSDAAFLSPACYWYQQKHLQRSLLRKHLSSLLLLFFLVCWNITYAPASRERSCVSLLRRLPSGAW